MYPHDCKLPATIPLGRFHARVWVAAGKVWFMLGDEPGSMREFEHGREWQPFGASTSLPASKIAERFTSCMYEADAKPIREPLADLIEAAVDAHEARLRGNR